MRLQYYRALFLDMSCFNSFLLLLKPKCRRVCVAEDPELELVLNLTCRLALFAQRCSTDQVGQRYITHNLAGPEKLIGLICARVITQTQRENRFIDQNKHELSTLVSDIKPLQASSLCASCNWFQMEPLTALQGGHLLSCLIKFPAEVR